MIFETSLADGLACYETRDMSGMEGLVTGENETTVPRNEESVTKLVA